MWFLCNIFDFFFSLVEDELKSLFPLRSLSSAIPKIRPPIDYLFFIKQEAEKGELYIQVLAIEVRAFKTRHLVIPSAVFTF